MMKSVHHLQHDGGESTLNGGGENGGGGGLHHRDNVAINIDMNSGHNGNGARDTRPIISTPPRTKRRHKKSSFWARFSANARRRARNIYGGGDDNYAKYGKKRVKRNDKLQSFLFWGTICLVSFIFGFVWKHYSNSTLDDQPHPQLRHGEIPPNPYAKLQQQQQQLQNDNNSNKPNQLLIPRFDTRRYVNSWENKLHNAAEQIIGGGSSKKQPQSILLEGWTFPIAFRNFPYARQTHGPIKNLDSDYGGLTYKSIRNENTFARVISTDSDDAFGAFEPASIASSYTSLKTRNRRRKATTGSYPEFDSHGTKVLRDKTVLKGLETYYDDDSVKIFPKSNDYKKIPRACKKTEFAHNYFPTCNAFHEHDLGRVYDDPKKMIHQRPENEIYKKYLAHGFYRDVWIVEDQPWIWPTRYPKENEQLPSKKFGVEDEARTSEMITKAYRSTALKTFQMKHPFSDEHWEEVQLEAIIMESMTKSPRIMDLYGHCGFSTMVEVVPIEFEEVVVPGEGYESHDKVEKRNKNGVQPFNNFTATEKLTFALEMAESLADIHGFEGGVIVHDDVQLCQWLHTPDGKLKLGDFNRATIMQWDMVKGEYCKFNNGPAFANYRAPEEFAALNLNEQIDTFSFGNNIYAMLTGLWNYVSLCFVCLTYGVHLSLSL